MIAVAPRPTLFIPGRFFLHPAFDYLVIGGGASLLFAVAMATIGLDLTLNGGPGFPGRGAWGVRGALLRPPTRTTG